MTNTTNAHFIRPLSTVDGTAIGDACPIDIAEMDGADWRSTTDTQDGAPVFEHLEESATESGDVWQPYALTGGEA